jgi:hypothetical protein
MLVLQFISNFLDENPLCCCADEISSIKSKLLGKDDLMKLRQKNSSITLSLKEDAYFYTCNIVIPNNYPESAVQ